MALTVAVSRLCNRVFNTAALSPLYRFNKYRYGSSYEGEGKTVVNIMQKDIDAGLMIEAISLVGFRFTNEVSVMGPIILFPKIVMSWRVANATEINQDSLCIFKILEPKIDILVVGVGDKSNMNFANKISQFGRNLKINVEVLPTVQAVSSFNFLTAENRNVAGAFIPPEKLKISDDDLMVNLIEGRTPHPDIFST